MEMTVGRNCEKGRENVMTKIKSLIASYTKTVPLKKNKAKFTVV